LPIQRQSVEARSQSHLGDKICGGRKGADLGDDSRDRSPSERWHFFQSFDDIAKGRECAHYAGVEGGNAFRKLFDCA
jgi:hypothetical protein